MLKIHLFLSLFSLDYCILLNKLDNIQIVNNAYQTLYYKTQDECVCEMMKSNGTKLTLNYLSTNQTCLLFHSNLTTFAVQLNLNYTVIYTNEFALVAMFRKFDEKYCMTICKSSLKCIESTTSTPTPSK